MNKHSLIRFLLTFCLIILTGYYWSYGQTPNAWINEIHYDNDGGDEDEMIEVVVEVAGNWDLSLLRIDFYNGNGGSSYKNNTIDSYNLGEEHGSYSIFSCLVSGIQNGAPDGLALSYDGTVIQFLSYEGVFTATDGPANGQTSTDIGVFEDGSDPVGESLQLAGTGYMYSDFAWQTPSKSTLGKINTAQILGTDTIPPVASWDPENGASDVSITTNLVISFDETIRDITTDAFFDNATIDALITFNQTDEEGDPVSFDATIENNQIITITPDAELINSQLYYIAVGEVEDTNDNASNTEYITFTTIAPKDEPENHVTDFIAAAPTHNAIKLHWQDAADGSQSPDGYLIKASNTSIIPPSDAADPLEDKDLSDGDAIVKVPHGGDTTYIFEGLTPGTSYKFKIWPYTNEGLTIDFKLDGDVPEANVSTKNTELFISEYIKGSSNNKAIEIYNGTGVDVDLSAYILRLYFNGSNTFGSSIELSGTLAHGDVYVISNGSANDSTIIAESDTTSGVTNFNGDDVVELVKKDVSIDIIGVIGNDPGTSWEVAGISNATSDHTLIRKSAKAYGNMDWSVSAGTENENSEWIVMPLDYTNNLGDFRIINSDTTVADLTVDGKTITGFDPNKYTYTIELPFGTIDVPTVSGIANDNYATIEITQAQNLTGTESQRTAIVTVTADNLCTQDYIVVFYIAQNTANDITGFVFEDFEPNILGEINKKDHTVNIEVPYGINLTHLVPMIEISDSATISPKSGVAQNFTNPVIYTVTAADSSEQDWIVTVNEGLNTENDIQAFVFEDLNPVVEGVIDNEQSTVTLTVPYGTKVTSLKPTIHVSPEAVVNPKSGVEQDFTNPVHYTVMAEDSSEQIWEVAVNITDPGNDANLADIEVDGFSMVDFSQTTYNYVIQLPYNSTETPIITIKKSDINAHAVVTNAKDVTSETEADRTTTVTVTAEDGSTTQKYTILFNVADTESDASLSDLRINGTTIERFSGLVFEYYDTIDAKPAIVPTVTAKANVSDASINIVDAVNLSGTEEERTTTITVTAENNINQKIYTITFYVKSCDATVKELTIDGALVDSFDPAVLKYNMLLPYGTTNAPLVEAIANNDKALVDISQATELGGDEAEKTALIKVTAEDEIITLTYKLIFTVADKKDLFFSEYIEGESYNKAIELYNPCANDVDLAPYTIKLASNGEGWSLTYNLSDTLASKSVYVIGNSGASTEILAKADTTSGVVNFNGNDALGLFKNDTLIDRIGVATEDKIWDVAGVTEATKNHTLLRKYSINKGGTNWITSAGTDSVNSEWIVLKQDSISNLGNFTTANNDATLREISINGLIVDGFSPYKYQYEVELPFGSVNLPLVDAITTDTNATTVIKQVTNLDYENEQSAVVKVTAENGVASETYTIVFSIAKPSSDAFIFSEKYVVDNQESVISEIPFGTSLDTLKNNLTPSVKASFEVYESDGETIATDLNSGCKVVVVAEDKITTNVYTISINEPNNEATLSSVDFLIDKIDYTITRIPLGTKLPDFENKLIPAFGASFETFETDGVTVADNLKTGYKVVVTAQDEVTINSYTVTVNESLYELFFSEYIEGTSDNKALEIYNPTFKTVDLSNYFLKGTANAATDWEYNYQFPEGASIASEQAYVIVNSNANQSMQDSADWVVNGLCTGFNGNDARGLFKIIEKDTTLIDVIGNFNNPEGVGYSVAGIEDALSNHTLIRKSFVTAGNKNWISSAGTNSDTSEWLVLEQDFSDNLGVHAIGLSSEAEIIEFTFGEAVDYENVSINSALATVDITWINENSNSVLAPAITISEGAAIIPESDVMTDFTNPVVYKVLAEDGFTTKEWLVTVTDSILLSNKANIVDVKFPVADSVHIHATDTSVVLYVPFGFDVTSVKPEFTISADATIADTSTARDFSVPQVYVVTAQDGKTIKNWKVSIEVEKLLLKTMYDIQYTAQSSGDSPFLGDKVLLSGIVTHIEDNRVWLQDGAGAWNGIVVYSEEMAAVVEIGYAVEFAGQVEEYYCLTQLNNVVYYDILSEDNDLPAASDITTSRANDEGYESVLIKVKNVTCTNDDNGEGMFEVDDGSGAILVDDVFYNFSPALHENYDIIGIADNYNNQRKILPRSREDINTPPLVSDIALNPENPYTNDDVVISAALNDDHTNIRDLAVALYYGYNEGEEDVEISFVQVETSDWFEGVIPASEKDIFYKIVASDGSLTSETSGSYSVITGIKKITGNFAMKIYPNPGNGLFILEVDTHLKAPLMVEIIDIQGQVIYQQLLTHDGYFRQPVDIGKEGRGIYFIKIYNPQMIRVAKILVQ